jgi:Raf kinase inhibitor-like YbhB/YbcL family protein
MKRLLLALVLVGCGGDDGPINAAIDAPTAPNDGTTVPGDGARAVLTVTSSAFTDGGAIPITHTCKAKPATDYSPPLAWTGSPAAAKSLAVVLTDLSIGRIHWALFDIPPTTTSLPLNIDKVYAPVAVPGAHQVSAQKGFNGYQGPCPPNQHTYELAVYPLDVAVLPEASADSVTSEVVGTIGLHSLGRGAITATFTP